MRFRIDSKYERSPNISNCTIEFFERKLSSNLIRDSRLPLKGLDFVIYNNNNLLVGAEIKTLKETSGSTSAWYSYHTKTTKRIQPNSVHKGIEKLPTAEKGFVATIDGQIRQYSENIGLTDIWLIQEGLDFKSEILSACSFLKTRRRIKSFNILIYKEFVFCNVEF